MASNIDIKVTGVRGGSPNYQEDKGKIEVFIDSGYTNDNLIVIDAFSGSGDSRQRRDNCMISIKDKYGRFWEGTFDDLEDILFGRAD